jgi:hypothetical protein
VGEKSWIKPGDFNTLEIMREEESLESPSNLLAGDLSKRILMAPGKGFEPLRARSPPAILPFRLCPLSCLRSRGWRVNHSATPATATEVIVCNVKMFPATQKKTNFRPAKSLKEKNSGLN